MAGPDADSGETPPDSPPNSSPPEPPEPPEGYRDPVTFEYPSLTLSVG